MQLQQRLWFMDVVCPEAFRMRCGMTRSENLEIIDNDECLCVQFGQRLTGE